MKESPLSSIFLIIFPYHSIVRKYNHIINHVSSTLNKQFQKNLKQETGHFKML